MTLTDKTAQNQSEAIEFHFDLPHAPQKVWRALTEPELLAQWLLPVLDGKLKLEAGAEFTYRTDPYPGWDGTVNCRMIEIAEPHKLSYAWTVPFLDTVVTFTLTPTDSGTHMTLVQTGFKPEQKQNFAGARYGWNMMGGKLEALLAGME